MNRQIGFWAIGAGTGVAWFCLLSLPINPNNRELVQLWAKLFALERPLLFFCVVLLFAVGSLISQMVLRQSIRQKAGRHLVVASISYTLLAAVVIGTLLMVLAPFGKERIDFAEALHPYNLMLGLPFSVVFGVLLGVSSCVFGALGVFPAGFASVWLMRRYFSVDNEPKEPVTQAPEKASPVD